jgi:hypothetical protein
MNVATFALLGVVLAAAAGCQRPAAVSVAAKTSVDHATEGHKAFDRQDWSSAASHYRVALQKSPDDLVLHYRLAIAASWLDLRDEATAEFEWVATRAASTSDEARVAREWLAAARGGSVATGGAGADTAASDETAGDSAVHGRVVWDEGNGAEPLKRFQLHLYAQSEDGRSKGMSFAVRTDRDGNYRFDKIPPGTYKMTDNNVGMPRWRLKVDLRLGEDVLIDLGPQNSINTRDDFPRSS